MTSGLVSAFGLLAIAWSNAAVVAVLPPQHLAQATTGTSINRPPLRAGSQGVAVSELQAALKLLGYYAGTVDGVYSESTVIAVSRFQQAAGLNPDGVVGPGTWDQLFPVAPSASTNNSAAGFPVPASATKKTSSSAANRSAPNNTSVTNSKPAPASGSRSAKKTPSTSVDLPVLRLGMQGSAVTRLQKRLQAVGLFKGVVDGVFGSNTEAAVKAAQRRYRLNSDGVVGTSTWRALLPQSSRSR